LALVVALAAYPAAAARRDELVIVGVGGVACIVVALGMAFRWWLVLAWGFALFGAEYAVFLRLRADTADVRAPLVAAALLIAVEVAFDSIAPESGRREHSLIAAEVVAVVGAAVVTVLAGALLLVVAGSATSGVALEAAGALAAVGVVAAVVRLARTRVL
jgi:hypothetical protein